MSTFLYIYIGIITFMLGAVMGSFLNCCCIRLINGESITKGRSHCMSCGHTLGARDLVPIFSWLFHKGKCKYCGEKISPRYLFTELILATAYTLCFIKYGFTIDTIINLILISLIFCAALCDIETHEIPDRFFIMVAILWVVRVCINAIINKGFNGWELISSGIAAIGIPCILLLIAMILGKILKKDALGMGDVKMFFAINLHLMLAKSFLNIMLTCVIGIIFILIFAKNDRRSEFPFMPAIATATFATLMCGDLIINFYLNLIAI